MIFSRLNISREKPEKFNKKKFQSSLYVENSRENEIFQIKNQVMKLVFRTANFQSTHSQFSVLYIMKM